MLGVTPMEALRTVDQSVVSNSGTDIIRVKWMSNAPSHFDAVVLHGVQSPEGLSNGTKWLDVAGGAVCMTSAHTPPPTLNVGGEREPAVVLGEAGVPRSARWLVQHLGPVGRQSGLEGGGGPRREVDGGRIVPVGRSQSACSRGAISGPEARARRHHRQRRASPAVSSWTTV